MGEDKESNASLPEPIIEGETDSRNTHTLESLSILKLPTLKMGHGSRIT